MLHASFGDTFILLKETEVIKSVGKLFPIVILLHGNEGKAWVIVVLFGYGPVVENMW